MNPKPVQKKWWIAILIAAVVAVAAIAIVIAVGARPNEPVSEPLAEEMLGVYYYDTVDGEYLLTISEGNIFTLAGPSVNKTGKYIVSGDDVILDFVRDEDGTTAMRMEGNTVEMTYQGADMTFRKKVNFTVSFCGEVADQIVVNGRTVQRPVAPEKKDHVFLGWYADDALTQPFDFGSTVILQDTTIYPKWAAGEVGQAEFTVDFDLCYEGANAPETVQTVGGKLHTLPDEPVREGYVFKGWWISVFEDGNKLTCRYSEETVFTANTTLFALWETTDSVNLQAPNVSVSAMGLTWESVPGASGYQVVITDGDGNVILDEFNGGTVRVVEFDSMPEGDYIVQVTAIASVSGKNSEPAVRYFRNKCLDRVSRFQVIDGMLVFNAVANATKYLVSIDCGNQQHEHTLFDNGNCTAFYFGNCDMQPGGIRISVTATANGYASSTSEEFVYDRSLSSVENIRYDAQLDAFVWDYVKNAVDYVVTVTVDGKTHSFRVGSRTQFSTGAYTGRIAITVKPVTEGYNSPEATAAECDKTAPATPSGIRIDGMILSWDAAMGATSYEVKIGGQSIFSDLNSVDLSKAASHIAAGQVYEVSVRASNGAECSAFSTVIAVGYYVMDPVLTYSGNTVYWTPVIGVSNYEVRVNGVVVATVSGKNSAEITLTQSGINTVEVRYTDYGGSAWSSIDVRAFKITYDSRSLGGEVVEYVAIGDRLSLPDHFTNTGYTFAGWYNSPSASQGNGRKIESDIFTGNADTVYYADWKPQSYKVHMQVEGYDLTNIQQGDSFDVIYTKDFSLAVPVSSNPVYTSFVGWFTGPSGSGQQLTDSTGASMGPFRSYHDVTAYPFFNTDIFSFELTSDGTYAVKAGPNIDKMTEVTVPYTYNGTRVSVIVENGFTNCKKLKVINIPDSISLVGTGAFQGAISLEEINVYESGEQHEQIYSSRDGALIRYDMGTVYLDVIPRAKTGTFVIPEEITVLVSRNFQLSALSEIVVSKNVLMIYERAFYRCEALNVVRFEGDRTDPITLDGNIFYSCANVNTLALPAKINEFDLKSLNSLTGLTCIEVEDGGELYGSVNGMLTNGIRNTILYSPVTVSGSIEIPVGIRAIGDNAFSGREGILSVTIPAHVDTVGASAFANCTRIKTITIVGNRTQNLTIGAYAFSGCAVLDSVIFEGGDTLAKGAITIGTSAFAPAGSGEKRLRIVEFRDGVNVESIGVSAFANQSALYNLHFGQNIRIAEISASAFANDILLPSISIPASTTKIGDRAFSGCTGIASVTFPEDGNEVAFGSAVFYGCVKLSEINLPSTVTSFAGSVFQGCDSIIRINVAPDNPYLVSEDGVLYSRDYTALLYYPKALPADWDTLSRLRWDTITTIGDALFANNQKVTSFTIMKNVQSIGVDAFNGCSNLTEVTCESVNAQGEMALRIEANAFHACSQLKTISVPSYTSYIGASAFQGTAFSKFVMPQAVEYIGDAAFKQNKKLTAVEIPAKVAFLGNGAFYGCSSLAQVLFAENGAIMDLGTIGSTNGVFRDCVNLQMLDAKNRIRLIGSYAFYNTGICNDIVTTGMVLGSNVQEIGNHAFAKTTFLKYITIPENVTKIGNEAFNESGLKTIQFVSGGTELLTFGSLVFANTHISEITFPARTEVLYQMITRANGVEYCDFANMFANVTELENIHVEAGCLKFCSIDGVIYELDADGQPKKLLLCPVRNRGTVIDGVAIGKLYIPNTVVSVVNKAFHDIRMIHTVIFEEFDKTDERYGTQSLVLGAENPAQSVAIEFSVFGGLDTNTITYVHIPSHISVFSSRAFSVTKEKLTVDINADAYDITLGYESFYGSRVEALHFPGVKQLYAFSFSSCKELKDLEFGEKSTLKIIPLNGFNGASITQFTVPASVNRLDSQAFFQAKNLKYIAFAEDSQLQTIGISAFYGCENLTTVDLSNATKLEAVDNYAFAYTKISQFVFPESLKSVGVNLFYDCTMLTEITLSAGFTASMLYGVEINSGDQPFFNGCPALQNIYVSENNVELISENGVLYDRAKTIVYCFPVASTLQNYQIPDTVRTIEMCAFQGYSGKNLVMPPNLEHIKKRAFAESNLEHVYIPASVVSIGIEAFKSRLDANPLKSIVFQEGSRLESIGEKAFQYCKAIESIDIPDSVTTIGKYAFNGCQSLKSVILPAALTGLEDYVFMGCTSLTSVVLQQGVGAIGQKAFQDTLITSLWIPASVQTVANYAFDGCNSLVQVTFGEKSVLESIGVEAFDNCVLLHTINIPAGVKSIGANAFRNNGNLKHFDVPAGLTEIPEGMLYGCKNIDSITIPASVTKIGARAFADNAKITAIDIPATVQELGASAFEGCSNAERIVFASGSAVRELGGALAGNDNIFKGTSKAKMVVLPQNLTVLGSHVFEGCGMGSLSIPTTVTEIGEYAFADCDRLQNVTVSGNVTYLGDFAFFDCDALQQVNLGLGMEYIGVLAFGFCDRLTSAYIPASVIRIGSNPFAGTPAADQIQIDPDNKYFVSEDGFLYDMSKTILYHYPTTKADETYVIPDSIMEIAAGAFAGAQLRTMVFPAKYVSIEPYTFAYCKNLASVTIEKGIAKIGDGAFRGCSALNNVVIPETATNLGHYAFADCTSLNDFTFSGSSTYSIGMHFFENCSALKKVILPGSWTLSEDDARKNGLINSSGKLMPDAKKAIPSYMFAGTGIVHAEIPTSIKWIGTEGVFMNCKYMQTVKFASANISCQYIGNYFFYGCRSLTTVTIPRGALNIFGNSIGYSFAYCTSLKSVTINYVNTVPFGAASSGHMFEGCTSLTEVVFKGLGNTVAYMDYVGPYYFAGCTSLPAITLADRAAICDNAFDGCTALAFVSFGGSNGVEDSTLRMLGDYAFRNCTENWAMLLPKLPAYIGEHVFDGWTAQQAMKTHESIEEIKKLLSTGMFKGCNAEVYDKDMVLIEIDPETGLLKETP